MDLPYISLNLNYYLHKYHYITTAELFHSQDLLQEVDQNGDGSIDFEANGMIDGQKLLTFNEW